MTFTPPTYDLLSIGFGPASLAIAIALVEHSLIDRSASNPVEPFHSEPKVYSSLGGLQEALRGAPHLRKDPQVESSKEENAELKSRMERRMTACFIEESPEFDWHKEMLLPGSRMQISFLKDLATLRNPASTYSFLSYLHSLSPSRLVSFISLGQFSPTRREFSSYMKWCARKVEKEMSKTMAGSVFGYGERVIRVEPVLDISSEVAGVKLLKVVSRSSNDGTERIRFARNLIISTGGSAKIPASLQFTEGSVTGSKGLGRVIHTSRFLESIEPALKEITLVSRITALDRPLRIAVIGAGQSASEVFLAVRASLANHLPSTMDHRPEIDLYIRRSTMRPADASEFSNEVFDPGMSQAVHGLEEEGREMLMKEVRGTNYSVVNPRTVAEIYSTMYAQKVEEDIAASEDSSASSATLNLDPKLTIHPYSNLADAELTSANNVVLTIRNVVRAAERETRCEYDIVICGTGYQRSAWKEMLFPTETATATATNTADIASSTSFNKLFNSSTTSPSTPSDSPTSTSPSLHAHDTSNYVGGSIDSLSPYSTETSSTTSYSSSLSSNSSSSSSHGHDLFKGRDDQQHHTMTTKANDYTVAENYRLRLPKEIIGGGKFEPTIWLQGCNEASHGISDSLLSVLAVRSGEVLDGILREGSFD